MKTRSSSTFAFTLIEIITAMAIIVILTGLVIQIFSSRSGPGMSRAQGEISMLSTACESYMADFGRYPTDRIPDGIIPGVTDKLKPKDQFIPTASEYVQANIFLYKELTGDKTGSGPDPDGKPEDGEPRYLKEFDTKMLKSDRNASNQITKVKYFQDPWGYPYGYSTAAAREEMLYQQELKKSGNKAVRPPADSSSGFNSASFDLWSTGGSRPSSQPSSNEKKELEWAKWTKNW